MRGWLTPDSASLTEPLECRYFNIPAALWLYVNGALEELTREYNWELYGTATPEEVTQYFMGAIDGYSVSDCADLGGGMQYIKPNQQIVSSNQSELINVWSFATAELPADCTAVLLQVNMSATGNGTFTGGALTGTIGLGGAVVNSFTPDTGTFQFLVPVGEVGMRLLLSGGGATWTLAVSIAAYI